MPVPVGYGRQVARNRKLFAALTRRGPHRVLRGDLAFAGMSGAVYTPVKGLHLPGVAFGHDWLRGAEHYAGTCEHLASWGIVAAAPDGQRGLVPSVLTLGHDLGSALDVIADVRLGSGQISVDPGRRAVAGHGLGGAAAVFTAAGRPDLKAAAALFPSVTKPSAEEAATRVRVPGLVVAAPDDVPSLRTDALEVAANWDSAVLRVVDRGKAGDLAEKRGLAGLLGVPSAANRTQRRTRALLTGFLLFHLTGDKTYRDFAAPDAALPRTSRPDPDGPVPTDEDRIVALFR